MCTESSKIMACLHDPLSTNVCAWDRSWVAHSSGDGAQAQRKRAKITGAKCNLVDILC